MTEACLKSYLQADGVQAALQVRGIQVAAAQSKADLFGMCARELGRARIPMDKRVLGFFVPGRIEVLGKHTDYAGGRSLICAADRGFCLLAAPRADSNIRIFAMQTNAQAEFEFAADIEPTVGDWTNYPMSVARRLARNFPGTMRGADIAFASDLPPAAGMSSSSSLVIACFQALSAVNSLESRPEWRNNISSMEGLAGYIATHENGQTFGSLVGDKGVGTFGGSEDHTAILCCSPASMSLYSYCPVRFERRIPMPPEHCFIIGSSGVTADKTGSALAKYNRASLLARASLGAWNSFTGRQDAHLAAALDSGPRTHERILEAIAASRGSDFTSGELVARFEQFYEESEKIIPSACDALARNDLAKFGAEVDNSQELATRLLKNQVPETVLLASSARELGAAAASAFGAGFGGAVWAMVKTRAADDFLKQWSDLYKSQFPSRAANSRFFLTAPGPAAFAL